MFGRSWWIAILVLVLLHFGFPFKVHAQTGTAGLKYTAGTGQRQIVVGSDSTQYLLGGSASGMSVNDTQRDRDYTTAPKTLITAATLGPGNSVVAAAAQSVGEYSSLMVLVSWNTQAAADSDSVAFGLTFIGKLSTDMNDGYDFTLSTRDTARFARVDTTVIYGTSSFKTHTAYIIAQRKPAYSAVTSGTTFNCKPTSTIGPKLYTVPAQRIYFSDGRNGVCFNLADSGLPVKLSHIAVQVQNLAGTVTYNNVTVSVWPKVN